MPLIGDGCVDVQDAPFFFGVVLGTGLHLGRGYRSELHGDLIDDGLDLRPVVRALFGSERRPRA